MVGQDERVSSPRLVTSDDWPVAELHAAVLAGELVAVGPCWASPAEPQDPALRAAAHGWRLPDPRLVASGRSAAWIWGACSRAPEPLEVSLPSRVRVPVDPDVRLREVRLPPTDVVRFGTVAVTTPLRTAVDLLRVQDGFDDASAGAVHGLLVTGTVDEDAVHAALDALGTVPMVRQAARRLRTLTGRAGPTRS